MHKYYKFNQIYDFKIVGFDTAINKHNKVIPIIYVEDIDKNKIKVASFKWQKENIWTYGTLKCEVSGLSSNGIPRLINKDFRHPFYKIDQEYEFRIIAEKSKVTETGTYNIFELQGDDGCIHEVNRLPIQKFAQNSLETVQCKVLDITTRLHLTQVNVKDQYYVPFEKIVGDKHLENKYFTPCFDDSSTFNKDVFQLVEQYNSKSAFWVFTFTNRILVKRFRDSIARQDCEQAREINLLIIIFEEWILKKGIIRSFPDEEIRKITSLKAKDKLESAKIRESVLSILDTKPFNLLDDDSYFADKENSLARFYYIIRFANIELIDCNKFVYRLQEIINSVDTDSGSAVFYLKSLLSQIYHIKRIFISEKEKEYFSILTKIPSIKFTESESKYIIFSYGEMLIAQLLSRTEYVNILIGRLLKLFSKSTSDVSKKEILLFNAYRYFQNYQNTELPVPFFFNGELSVNFVVLENNDLGSNDGNNYWDELEESYTNKIPITVRLTKKSKNGYEVNYNNLSGFLPLHHIKDRTLKIYPFEESDFTINVKCLSISKPFRFFIVEQLVNSGYGDSCKNNFRFIVGKVYDAIIKNVVDYGVFLITNAGEGLLYVNDIFDFNWNKTNISKYFKIGQGIKVVLTGISNDSKVSFNFYRIKEFDLLYYNDYVDRTFQKNAIDYFETNVEFEEHAYFDIALFEKPFCIEQFALLQMDINDKIHNFQVAKQFYANANSARSFLINIYISYFEILLNIKTTLKNGSLDDIVHIQKKATEIKNKINQKTIDTFSDSDKLIFFLDIISMFNEKSEQIQEALFEYIKRYDGGSSYKDLKTIAKIALANNLLISESKEDSNFSLKNLRLIFDFLSNGILSLEETVDDRNARELKEEILYWVEKIKEDESEILEFKSSFFTPIPDEKKNKRLEILRSLEKQTEETKLEISRISGDLARKAVIHSALKTVVAFANSKGGTLLIGVDDNKNVIGLEQEFRSLKGEDQSRDGFGKLFDDTVRNYIGDSFSSLMSRKFLKFPGGDILIVKIKPSNHEVFLRKNEEGKDVEQLYIRDLSSSKELTGSELVKFIKNKLDSKRE